MSSVTAVGTSVVEARLHEKGGKDFISQPEAGDVPQSVAGCAFFIHRQREFGGRRAGKQPGVRVRDQAGWTPRIEPVVLPRYAFLRVGQGGKATTVVLTAVVAFEAVPGFSSAL